MSNQPEPNSSRSSASSNGANPSGTRPWIFGALFVWTLTGAVALAAYSNREVPKSDLTLVPESSLVMQSAATGAGSEAETRGKGIRWEADFESAMQRARVENKPIFIDFYTDWCGVCKTLDREVLPQESVVSESRNWVSIRINAEKRPDVAGAYGVTGYPTLVFAAKSGKPLSILPGMAPVNEFVAIMKRARGKLKSNA